MVQVTDKWGVSWTLPEGGSPLQHEVQEALSRVYDPCSLSTGAPLSLLDMGLVTECAIDAERNVTVTVCVTSASCMMAPVFMKAATDSLLEAHGVNSATVTMDHGVFWTEDRLSETGRRRRGSRRLQDRVGLQAWRNASDQQSATEEA